MFRIQDFKTGDRVKVRKGNTAYEGVVVDFYKRSHIFIQGDNKPKGHLYRALPHWITEIVDEGNK
jgi:hypothetical protein